VPRDIPRKKKEVKKEILVLTRIGGRKMVKIEGKKG